MLSGQNILNSRKITADIEEKFANQREVLRRGISLYLSYQTNWNHATEPQTLCHVISEPHWKSNFDFSEIVNKLRIEARSRIANCEIYFPIFSETIHFAFKEISDYIYQNVYTTIEFIFIRESYTYYNVVLKNKNVLYIIYEFFFIRKLWVYKY